MTDASSKIDVRRLKVQDLLINILVHCALPVAGSRQPDNLTECIVMRMTKP